MGRIEVLNPGLFTTIQDRGRFGFRRFGVPVSGAMDSKSYDLANELVGNPAGSPAIELTLMGGSYRFHSGAIIALTGATLLASLNGEEIKLNTSTKVETGQELKLGSMTRGARTYLAIRGKWKLDKVMDSYSTYTTGKFGGIEGRVLQKGDVLEWGEFDEHFEPKETEPDRIPYFSSKITVRAMPGPEWDWLEEETQNQFLRTSFEVNSKSNRMGIRLTGSQLNVPDRQMISSPVLPGVIQLPQSGNPIILMNDGQTIGGYPRIAKVLDEELWRLGQVKAGDIIRFSLK